METLTKKIWNGHGTTRKVKGRKKWIGLALVVFLCLTGVYGARVTDNIPVYTSFSDALGNCQAADYTGEETGDAVPPVRGACVPIQRFYQNDSIRLPEGAQPREQIRQACPNLLQRARPGRRIQKSVEEMAAWIPRTYGQTALICRGRETGETAVSPCRSRIISYIHDQDGQKDPILSL